MKKTLLLLGFVLTAYLKLPAVAVAALGVVICVVIISRDIEIAHLPAGGAASTAPKTKTEEEEDFFA